MSCRSNSTLCDVILVCLHYLVLLRVPLVPSSSSLPESVEEVSPHWAPGISWQERVVVRISSQCPQFPQCLWAREKHLRHMRTKRLPGMGQLRGCTPLDGSACLLQCCWTNEKHWGPAEEQMPSWISPSAVAVSHLLFCLPASLFLVGKESLMPNEEGEHILWPIIFGETLIDPPCGIRLVWYCQRASHSIKDRISLLRFPPVTGMGVGKHLVWVAIMLSF